MCRLYDQRSYQRSRCHHRDVDNWVVVIKRKKHTSKVKIQVISRIPRPIRTTNRSLIAIFAQKLHSPRSPAHTRVFFDWNVASWCVGGIVVVYHLPKQSVQQPHCDHPYAIGAMGDRRSDCSLTIRHLLRGCIWNSLLRDSS